MDLKRFIHDDDAASPVIVVILMVVITVVQTAVIASFVTGLGDQQQRPKASFSFDYEPDSSPSASGVVITHESGDTIDADRISIEGQTSAAIRPFTVSRVQSGDTAKVDLSGLGSGDTISVVWTGADGTSTTLATWEHP